MGLCSKISFSPMLYVLGISLIVGHVVHAQDSPEDYVNAHNAARSKVGVQNIVWNETVAAFARNYANQRKGDCQLVHSGGGGGSYGENIAMSPGDISGTEAMKMWVDDEIANYDYNSNSCVGDGQCLHYTQVVWSNTLRIGCAKVRCDNGGTFIVCNYHPPGNYVGEKPY